MWRLKKHMKHDIIEKIISLGAHKAGFVEVADIKFDPAFRKLCESNACGNYNRSWMCPPCMGEMNALIAQAKAYKHALVYQTVDPLEDSYDFEGMMDAGKRMNDLTQKIRDTLGDEFGEHPLRLGAGGCRLCEKCAKITNEPCRYPDKAMSSLETFGVDVSALAALAGMKYINGQDTVTYFGAVFFGE